MHLCISGFLIDDSDDDSLKFELDVPEHQEQGVMEVMGWKNFAEGAEGEFALHTKQIQQIEQVLKEPLPHHLALYIGVEA